MKIYLEENVMEALERRLNFLFDEFDEVTVCYSGGKDSTVLFEVAKKIARQRGKLPLSVLFIDQEAEWTFTIEMVKHVMYDPDVEPYWYQIPIKIENATSYTDRYLHCWEPGKEWLREKDPISIKENIYGVEWWPGIFQSLAKVEFAHVKRHCMVGGVTAEESPGRSLAFTSTPKWRHITWVSTKGCKESHMTFYPMYDWSVADVWKAIHDNGWKYNKIYDYQYRHGISLNNMRVSNLHHETAVKALFYLQEVDGDLYERLVQRLGGVDTAGKLNFDNFFVEKLPWMFKDWEEYALHLKDKLIQDEEWKGRIDLFMAHHKELFKDKPELIERSMKVAVQSILANDYAGTKMRNFKSSFVDRYNVDKKKGLI